MLSLQTLLRTTLLLTLLLHEAKLEVSKTELSKVMQTLWDTDNNRLIIGRDIRLNLQGRASLYNDIDQASGRLFAEVPNLMKKSTYKKFIDLLDNYVPLTHKLDRADFNQQTEQRTFINSILGTRVWQEAKSFIIDHGLVRSSLELSNKVNEIWFKEYSRAAGVTGSSGFEHVFVGELDGNKMQISGLHNWIVAYQLETSRTLNYQGYIRIDPKNNLYEIKLRQENYKKSGNTMFIGTSPEFEMAVYTICFLTRKNTECSFEMNGKQVNIQVYASYNGALATAYPKI